MMSNTFGNVLHLASFTPKRKFALTQNYAGRRKGKRKNSG